MVGQQVEAMPPSYDVRSQSWSADTCHPIKAHSAGVGCACKASIGDASAAGAAAPMGGWGLPTSSCPISPYLRDELPALHVQWMQQDRVLYHCPDAGGFGDWLRGLPSAFLLSIMLELAFVIDCDVVMRSHGRVIRTNSFVKKFFVGPHFDWRYDGHARVPDHAMTWTLTSSLMHGRAKPAPNSTRVYIKPSASARRFVRLNERKLSPLIGSFYVNASHDTTEGCFMRYLLAPSARLHELALNPSMYSHQDPETPNPLPPSWLASMGDGQQLTPAVAMHVRVGDGVFFRNASVAAEARRNKAWGEFLNETRPNLFTTGHAQRAMQCLAVASATPLSTASAVARARDGDCLPCTLVADSAEVVECAQSTLGPSVRATRGQAIQIVGSPADMVTDYQLNKTFLDWWLMARSTRIIFAGFSEFAYTAARFQAATTSLVRGGQIRAHDLAQFLNPDGRWRQFCDGSRSPDEPPPHPPPDRFWRRERVR